MAATLALFLCITGCVRRNGRNSDCKWPSETTRHAADAQHLSADAEFAEDLAIRYADTHHGLRTPYYVSGEAYAAARDRCMGALFEKIAEEHHVTASQIADSLGRNRALIDIAVNLPFLLLYCIAASAAARMIWRRYPLAAHGWIPGAIMALFLSLAFATGSTMLGEVCSWIVESYRIGNTHMSYRIQRLPWARHRTALFAGAVIVFWLATSERACRLWSNRLSQPNRTS